MSSDLTKNLNLSLFLLRLGVFLVMAMWVIDKFIKPEHTAAVFKAFYGIDDLGTGMAYVLGIVQAIVLIAFVTGFKRKWSYGLVFLMHAGSTLTPFARYFDPFSGSNLLFFAAWPMLAAIAVLFILREHDNWTLDSRSAA